MFSSKLILAAVAPLLLCGKVAAQVPITHGGLGVMVPPSGNCGSVWNPSDKDPNVSLSPTTCINDTATQGSAASAFKGLRGTQSYAVGTSNKRVFTIKIQQEKGSGDGTQILGVGDGSVTLSYPGATVNGFGVQSDGQGDYINGTPEGGSSVCSLNVSVMQGGTLWLAINFNNGHVFCSNNCTTWVSSGNPDSDIGAAYTLTSATYYPMWGGFYFSGVPDIATLNTTPSLAGCSNISTFSQWG